MGYARQRLDGAGLRAPPRELALIEEAIEVGVGRLTVEVLVSVLDSLLRLVVDCLRNLLR